MLAIRLTRTGAKKRPSYRIIVSEKRYKRDGAYVEKLGHYNPLTEPATIVIDKARFDYWMEKGAQPTDVVKRIVLGIKGTKSRKPKKQTTVDSPQSTAKQETQDASAVTAVPAKDNAEPSEKENTVDNNHSAVDQSKENA